MRRPRSLRAVITDTFERMSGASGQPVYITMREAGRLLGVSSPTLRRYDQRGLLTTYRTPGGHRRFLLSEVRALAGLRSVPS